MPILYPHVFGFRLQMAILTHPAFPLPIWGALQIRNHLLQCRPIPEDAVLDLETSVAGERVLEKGAEVDLHTSACSRGDLVWESRNTFYYRGRFGDAGPPSPVASAPVGADAEAARWRTDSSAGWRFGRLTGDYNGIHCWSWYARLFGFQRALHHPQLALGLCMARLDGLASAPVQRLDAWLKGPVYYGSEVRLRVTRGPGDLTFALVADDETRPAIVGRWRSGAQATALRDEPLGPYCGPAVHPVVGPEA